MGVPEAVLWVCGGLIAVVVVGLVITVWCCAVVSGKMSRLEEEYGDGR